MHKHASNNTQVSSEKHHPVSRDVENMWFEVKSGQTLIANDKQIYGNAYTRPSQQSPGVFVCAYAWAHRVQ